MAALAKMQQQQQGAGSADGNGSGATEQHAAVGAEPGEGKGTRAGCAADGRRNTAAAGNGDGGHQQRGRGEVAEEREAQQANAEVLEKLSRLVAQSQSEEAAWAAGAGPSGVLAPRVVVLLAQQAVGTLAQCGGVAAGEVMCLARELRPGVREALTARSLSPACNALADRGWLERRKEPQMSLRWVAGVVREWAVGSPVCPGRCGGRLGRREGPQMSLRWEAAGRGGWYGVRVGCCAHPPTSASKL